MGVYLPYLMQRFAELGGKIVQREIHSMTDALREAPLAVNCAGLGTLGFLPDKELFPIRGQVIRAAKLSIDAACGRRGRRYGLPRLYRAPLERLASWAARRRWAIGRSSRTRLLRRGSWRDAPTWLLMCATRRYWSSWWG